jgi:hypothetical protein
VAVEVDEAGVVPPLEAELSPPDAAGLLSGAADMIFKIAGWPDSWRGRIAEGPDS